MSDVSTKAKNKMSDAAVKYQNDMVNLSASTAEKIQKLMNQLDDLQTSIDEIKNVKMEQIQNEYLDAISAVEQQYVNDPSNKLRSINLWGGSSQTISFTPAANQVASWCDGNG